jgi:hypothetical protein
VPAPRENALGPSEPIPLTVLTGFLGAGKTSLLNRLITDPALAETAVIINEFGEIGLDHLLVKPIREGVVLLQSGCLCCTLRGDLVDALEQTPHQPAGRLACIPTWTLTCIPAFDLLPRLCPRIPRLGRWWAVSPGRDPASATHRVAGATERPALEPPGL